MKKVCLLLVVVLAMILLAGCEHDADYSVNYRDNGSTSGFPPTDNNKYKYGDEAIVMDKGSLLKEGHTFLNWNTKADGTGDSYLPGQTITINGAVFLYAIWVVLL